MLKKLNILTGPIYFPFKIVVGAQFWSRITWVVIYSNVSWTVGHNSKTIRIRWAEFKKDMALPAWCENYLKDSNKLKMFNSGFNWNELYNNLITLFTCCIYSILVFEFILIYSQLFNITRFFFHFMRFIRLFLNLDEFILILWSLFEFIWNNRS